MIDVRAGFKQSVRICIRQRERLEHHRLDLPRLNQCLAAAGSGPCAA